MVFGIPTVKRPIEMYLENTLHNIIENLTPDERLEVLIVVMIAEVSRAYSGTPLPHELLLSSTNNHLNPLSTRLPRPIE